MPNATTTCQHKKIKKIISTKLLITIRPTIVNDTSVTETVRVNDEPSLVGIFCPIVSSDRPIYVTWHARWTVDSAGLTATNGIPNDKSCTRIHGDTNSSNEFLSLYHLEKKWKNKRKKGKSFISHTNHKISPLYLFSILFFKFLIKFFPSSAIFFVWSS